jgi:heme exporter protein A
MKLEVELNKIKKVFNRRTVFTNINFKLSNGYALAITGRNGSGKSTMAKIIAGVLSPTNGNVKFVIDGIEINESDKFKHVGFVSPYLQLYDEFTAFENLELFAKIRSLEINNEVIFNLMKRVNLYSRKDDLVRTYSSGMKQRLKYAFALLHRPGILIFDEPRSNLDSEGINIIYDIIKEQKLNGVVIIATNDSEDLQYCDNIINLDDKNNK